MAISACGRRFLQFCLTVAVAWSSLTGLPAIAALDAFAFEQSQSTGEQPLDRAIAPSPPSPFSLSNGKQLFQQNCAVCHINGQNLIITHKTLDYEALKTYGMDSIEAITRQITYGKSVMPAFGESLSSDQIDDIATYVLHQAQQGW